MKHLFTRLIALMVLLLPVTASAYDFMVNGLAYEINSDGTSVSVTYTKLLSDSNYPGLTEANIPESVSYNGKTYSVTSIGMEAFYECSGLTSVTIPNSVTSIGGGAFSSCSGLTSVTIPDSVTFIGNGAFSHCSSLVSVTIPNSVTSINVSTFYGCSGLTNVSIPNSVTEIKKWAFNGCSSLTNIYSFVNHPANVDLGSDVFSGVNVSDCILHVIKGRLDEYRKAAQWKEFVNIVDDLDPPVVHGDVTGDGSVNVSDVSDLINMILGREFMNQESADVNGDGQVNVSDVTALVNIILGIQ